MRALEEPDAAVPSPKPVARWREAVPLVLALLAVLLGLFGLAPAGADAGFTTVASHGAAP
jgi:hypothetical protein